MNTNNSQEQTQTPKYKVGDEVWVPILRKVDDSGGLVFVQTTITAVVYSRIGGVSTFEGYIHAGEREENQIMKEAGVFGAREEAEALIDGVQVKANILTENE